MSAALRESLNKRTAELKEAKARMLLVTLDEAVLTVVKQHGGVRAASRATGIDKSFISRLMNGHKVAPSAETLQALGLRAVPLYEVLKTHNTGIVPTPKAVGTND